MPNLNWFFVVGLFGAGAFGFLLGLATAGVYVARDAEFGVTGARDSSAADAVE